MLGLSSKMKELEFEDHQDLLHQLDKVSLSPEVNAKEKKKMMEKLLEAAIRRSIKREDDEPKHSAESSGDTTTLRELSIIENITEVAKTKQINLLAGDLNLVRSTIAHKLCFDSSPEEYHRFVKLMIQLGMENIFGFKNVIGDTAIHNAFRQKISLLPSTIDLLSEGCHFDFNSKNDKGSNVLHLAAGAASRATLERIVYYGVDWNLKNLYGTTALHVASNNGNLEAIQYLLSLKATDVNAKNSDGRTALHLVPFGEPNFGEILKFLTQAGANINAVDNSGHNVLLNAAWFGKSMEDLDTILKFGGDWKMKNNEGLCVLHVSAHEGNLDFLQYFIRLGGLDVNERDNEQRTPLHFLPYAKQNFTQILGFLSNEDSDINAVDKDGNNLVHKAALARRSVDELKRVVKLGCDHQRRNNEGWSVLHFLASVGNVKALEYFLNLEGTDANSRTNCHCTPLHLISNAKDNFVEMLHLLLKKGADINAVDKLGNNPMMVATYKNRTLEELKEISERGGDWKQTNKKGFCILHLAAQGGHFEALRYFISLGANVNAATKNMETPLHRVPWTTRNFKETLAILQENGANMNAVTSKGFNLVHLAVMKERSKEDIEYIVDELKCDWKAKTLNGDTVLHIAAKAGNYQAVKYFLSLGADVSAKNKEETPPIIQLCHAKRNFVEILSLLMEAGADINSSDRHGNTLLMSSALLGRSNEDVQEIVKHRTELDATNNNAEKLLLCAAAKGMTTSKLDKIVDLGINLTTVNEKGRSLLHAMVAAGNAELVKYLISKGADVHLKDFKGRTPLHLCAGLEPIKCLTLVHLLLSYGADINTTDNFGINLLLLAAGNGKRKQDLKHLVNLGADWKASDASGQSILHVLTTKGNPDALEYFISLGADVNARNKFDETPLHFIKSVQQNFVETVKVLTENGADVQAVDAQGRNAYQVAETAGKTVDELKYLLTPEVKRDAVASIDVEQTVRKLSKKVRISLV